MACPVPCIIELTRFKWNSEYRAEKHGRGKETGEDAQHLESNRVVSRKQAPIKQVAWRRYENLAARKERCITQSKW